MKYTINEICILHLLRLFDKKVTIDSFKRKLVENKLGTNIKTQFYPTVEKALKSKSMVKALMDKISKYVDTNTPALSTIGPVQNIVFWEDKDRQPIYEMVNISKDNLVSTIKKTHELSRSVNTSDPFNVLMTLIIRYFRMNKMDGERKACCLYLALSMYPSLFSKYFKFKPNENIMEYTINNLSDKYKIKKTGTLLSALIEIINIADDHYSPEIKRFEDKDISLYIAAFKTRLNAFLKNICTEFMKNHAKGKYLNFEDDDNDPENFKVTDNNSLVIQRISQAVIMQVSVHGPDAKAIRLASQINRVSINDMRTTITSICKDTKNKEEIRKIISNILYEFLFTGKNSSDEIKSTKFTLYALQTFKKSNTSNKNVIEIKTTLNKWLERYSERYVKTNMVSTLNQFRRALYMFWIFTIQRTRF